MTKPGPPDGIRSFKEFWPHYVREHSSGVSRGLHVVGTLLGLALLAYLCLNRMWAWIWAPAVVGYGCAWIGHFVFENNRPATFRYPFYSLIGDFKMLAKVLTGKMRSEVRRHAK